jgi:hypothetical protein
VVEKVTRSNHSLWNAQVLAYLRGAQMAGSLDGSIKASEEFLPHNKNEDPKHNPKYVQWHAHDQQVLSYLLGSLSSKILGQVASAAHIADMLSEIQASFSTRSRARAINTRMVLASTVKLRDLSRSLSTTPR